MRLERLPRKGGPLPIGAILGGALLASVAMTAVWLLLGFSLPICHVRKWTGIPCPTCGSTRMLEALLGGDVAGALLWNPLVFVLLTALLVWALLSAGRLVGLPAWRPLPSPGERIALRIFAVAAVLTGWLYLLWRGV